MLLHSFLEELSLLVESHYPDIASVVESWLCAGIPDAEICIHGYSLTCVVMV